MESRLSRWIDGLFEACWLVALIAAPLYFNIHSERVFEPDKLALLRSIALIVAAGWLIKAIDGRYWKQLNRLDPRRADSLWRRPFAVVTALLILVYLLSTLFSITPRISFFGSYQRLQGTYSTLSYLVIFALMATTLRSREQVSRAVTVIIIASVPVAFYGLLQRFDLDPLPWGGNVSERIAGHLGNAIFIAAYLVMVAPLTLARIIDAFSNILSDAELSAADVVRSSAYIFILAIQLIAIYWSGSRGPLIGLLVGLFAFMLVLLVSLRDRALEEGQAGSRLRDAGMALLFLLPSALALALSKPLSDALGPLAAFLLFAGIVALSALAIFVLLAAGRAWRWLWLGWIMLSVFVGGWLIAFNLVPPSLASAPLVGGIVQAQDGWRDLPTIGSFGRMLDSTATSGREKSGRVRVLIWEGVVDLITPHAPLRTPDGRDDPYNALRPLIGYGPESMYVAYNRFYPPELATVESRNASPDRSHNETFDALVITGIAGFLVWQAVYLSAILFAFRYLGVVRSRRDTLVFLGLVVAGGLLAAALATWGAGSIYFGVAVPTGIIAGLIVYLIYYALVGRSSELPTSTADRLAPFRVDRLLMNALVAAVLAHYVEIHFGIAIASTRLYFFAYAALMVGLAATSAGARAAEPQPQPVPVAVPEKGERRKRKVATTAAVPAGARPEWGPLVIPALIVGFITALIGITFITYNLPPGRTITGPADLSAWEIFRQSLFFNTRRGFIESPFVFGMVSLTWALGWLIYLSEMARDGEWQPARHAASVLSRRKEMAAGGMAALMAASGVLAVFLLPAEASSPGAGLGRSLLLGWSLLSATAAFWLLTGRPSARLGGGLLAIGGLVLVPALLLAGGGGSALALAVACAILLFILWSPSWAATLVPGALLVAGSLMGGALVAYLFASRYRAALFYQTRATDAGDLRALEAAGAAGLLAFVYGFVLITLLVLATALAWPALTERRRAGRTSALGVVAIAAVILLPVALLLVIQTNMRAIQADMVFKRGRPFDEQATRIGQSDAETARQSWDAAIALYDAALERLPTEDFYYLFLGRALLERSALTDDAAEKAALLQEAERRLLDARDLNPLNTDHTANLARLNTRWYGATADEAERARRLAEAERYYQEALALSPQNSVVRNEFARLVLELRQDCDRALALYDESASIDPFFVQTFLVRADAYVACGAALSEPDRSDHFEKAAESLEQALALDPSLTRAWVQLAEVYRQQGANEAALEALAGARESNADLRFPTGELDFIEARIRAAQGDLDAARALAEGALPDVGPETAAEIEAFLVTLGGG